MANAMRGALKHNGVYMLPYTDNIPCDPAPTENSENYLTSGVVFTVKTNLETLINGKLSTGHDTDLSSHAAGFNHDLIMTVSGRKLWLENDGTYFKILYSDLDGTTWNSKRPFIITLDTGDVSINDGFLSFSSNKAHFLWDVTFGSVLDLGVRLGAQHGIGGQIKFHWLGSSSVTSTITETASGTITVSGNLTAGGNLVCGNISAGGDIASSGNISTSSNIYVGDANRTSAAVLYLRADGYDTKLWADDGIFYILCQNPAGTLGNWRPFYVDMVHQKVEIHGHQKQPNYGGKTDITSAWSTGSWTSSANGWLIIGMGRSSGVWTLYTSSGELVAHVGKNDSGAVMTAYPIPVVKGEEYELYSSSGSGYHTLAPRTTKQAPDWAYFVPGR